MWNCPELNATRSHWRFTWLSKSLVTFGNKPLFEPMLTQISVQVLPYGVTRSQWVKASWCQEQWPQVGYNFRFNDILWCHFISIVWIMYLLGMFMLLSLELSLNPCHAEFILGNIKCTFFFIIFQQRYIIEIFSCGRHWPVYPAHLIPMVAVDLVMQGTRASTAMVLI